MGPQHKKAAVVVAHPDDEIIWTGGSVLLHPEWEWTIAVLCRKSDEDRAPRFGRILKQIGAHGAMADLDDGPEQTPLSLSTVKKAILSLLAERRYDYLISHSPRGEYWRHRRHEETGRAVAALWCSGLIRSTVLFLFAYEDGRGRYPPRPVEGAHIRTHLPAALFKEKRRLITEIYGFSPESPEVRAALPVESFWSFTTAEEFRAWHKRTKDPKRENTYTL